jgi:transcriptional regulator PpsR
MAFSAATQWLEQIDATSVANLIAAASDIALIIEEGPTAIVGDATFSSEDLAQEFRARWAGQPWAQTVTAESRPKIEALLADAAAGVPLRWRQVNHPSPNGEDLPVVYAATRIGNSGRFLAVGRNLRPVAALQQRLIGAQQSLEREYGRLRQAEARHRLLFQVSGEAMLVVDAATRRIVEANPAAGRILGTDSRELTGRAVTSVIEAPGRPALDDLLAGVRATGRMDSGTARTADGAREMSAAVSLFREDRASYFLVRLTPAARNGLEPELTEEHSRVLDVVAQQPDAFLVTDPNGRIQFANPAFLDMVQLASEEQARGEPLERWLGRPGVDFNLLNAHLREHGSIRLFATTLRGSYGATVDVEISGVAVPDGDDPCLGFTMRDVGQRVATERLGAKARPRSMEQVTELVGRVPLKELVRESSDVIERLCIEAALELTDDNRASAAEILGLSRQSLYAKLRRYGLGDLADTTDERSRP